MLPFVGKKVVSSLSTWVEVKVANENCTSKLVYCNHGLAWKMRIKYTQVNLKWNLNLWNIQWEKANFLQSQLLRAENQPWRIANQSNPINTEYTTCISNHRINLHSRQENGELSGWFTWNVRGSPCHVLQLGLISLSLADQKCWKLNVNWMPGY